ncbi:MAG: dTMP kinase [Sulfurovum sp.]|nr:dTMP kinase [Sulfurovum sp.]
MVVLFEGIDTCGKSTQLELLKQKHPEIITTKEPGGTAFGIKAREILLESTIISKRAELLLFLADRAEHFEEVIQPNQDKLVISDRGFISGIGYALANGDFELDELLMLNRFALQGDFPDKVILFLTDMQTLQERLGGKSLDGIEQRGLEYLLSVQEHMKQTVLALDIPHLFIDASDSIENIHQTILTYLKV